MFKKNTNDTRESAAIYVADELFSEHAHIAVYDPKVKAAQILNDLNNRASRSEQENEALLQPFADPYEASKDGHVFAFLTEWDEFITYDWKRIYDQMLIPAFVFDGRNVLDITTLKEIGFIVYSLGR